MDELKWYFTNGLASFSVRSIELSDNYSTKAAEPSALTDAAIDAASKEKRIRATLAQIPADAVRTLSLAFGHCPPHLAPMRDAGIEYPALVETFLATDADDHKRNARLLRAARSRAADAVADALRAYRLARSELRKTKSDSWWRFISGE